ncbi:2-oxo acid dehydrogenase subunit E2 [Aquibacillus sp. 3ASR75-11]|uniref:Dihydrolipoamide acetyltransferase component of pyruvate dehydrogenase complex n=1 Tax=Terrihalobacillus insolitus TaxID=2950438 RepID=A0A9X4APA0_9BACI|nr:dihydrolipoamide acetyltransferase family protein [Terrihalobacillus insolitus]MDC3414455.1 2-oxo acid dehydrogenase subunit E2 [Terrihalobacillus insolitus]MDC3425335.1 2-oxo acid dehydrogenase subunit E2 [Terrihalobacillus insolitus]
MTTEKINMPKLGESVTEGTISNWLVQVGDHVNKYDPIAEVMTDKVNAEVPSSFTGTIKEIVAKEDETLEVGELMCYIDTEDISDSTTNEASRSTPQSTEEVSEQSNQDKPGNQPMKKRYSPAVLKLAQENDIVLDEVNGSGRGGRITRKDIEKIIAAGGQPTAKTTGHSVPDTDLHMPSTDGIEAMSLSGDKEIPVTGVRKAIAQNMVRAKTEIPHAWMMVEVDVTDLVAYRKAVKDQFKKEEGFGLTYFAFFVKAVAQAVKEFPQLNSSWAGDKIIQHKDVHLSIAVAKDQELFVPVIKNADEKNIKGIAKDIYTLAAKARDGKLTAADMEGGTFTVNNTGSFGSVQSMGVINYPQAAILQVESIVKKPVIIDGMFAARDMVNLCLSLDHRILDGLICGQFLARLKEILENMSKENTTVY